MDNVFAQIKADLGPNVLTSQFAQCSFCFTSPLTKSSPSDTVTAREISRRIGQKSGQLNIDSNGVTHNFRQSGNVITVTVGPNEMLVVKP